jgi:hypothetical protein
MNIVQQDIVSDRDQRIGKAFWENPVQSTVCKQRRSTNRHPQMDEQTDRADSVLEDILRYYVSPFQNDGDELLPTAEFAMSNVLNVSTRVTPVMFHNGQHPYTPLVAKFSRFPEVNQLADRWVSTAKACKALLGCCPRLERALADEHRRLAEKLKPCDRVLVLAKHFKLQTSTRVKALLSSPIARTHLCVRRG